MLNPFCKAHYFINRHWSKQFFRLSSWLWLSLLLMKVSFLRWLQLSRWCLFAREMSEDNSAYFCGMWYDFMISYTYFPLPHIFVSKLPLLLSSWHNQQNERACFRITLVSYSGFLLLFWFHAPYKVPLVGTAWVWWTRKRTGSCETYVLGTPKTWSGRIFQGGFVCRLYNTIWTVSINIASNMRIMHIYIYIIMINNNNK